MFPIFIFTGMGSEPQNAFLPPCGCFRRKQKQQMPCAAAALPVKKEFRKIRRFSGILIHIENHKLCLWKKRAVALKR